MVSEIKLLEAEWTYNGEDLNNYMKQLAIKNPNITGITLDLSNSKFNTQTSYYSIKIPNNIVEFTLIGKIQIILLIIYMHLLLLKVEEKHILIVRL